MEENIVLVGFMGSGKSAVGREVARRLGRPFVDTDELVVRRAGLSIPEIFARLGEAEFRRLEAEAVAEVAAGAGQVIATGGGVLLREENVRRLKATGRLLLLRATPEAILERLEAGGLSERPLLSPHRVSDPAGTTETGAVTRAERLERIRDLLAQRQGAYEQADEALDTSGMPLDGVVQAVIDRHLARRAAAAAPDPAEVLRVSLGERGYDIVIGGGVLDELGPRLGVALGLEGRAARGTPVLVVTHPEIEELYGRRATASLEGAGFRPRVARVPAGEESKSLEQAGRLYDACVAAGLDRGSPVVALGGGVVGDLAGFVAATFLRGLPFVQVPTTLLAQVDAGVGGKVAVNHPRAKNLIGAFHQPRLVLADVAVLRTLPPREFAAGMAEVIKHGVIADPAYFEFLEASVRAIKDLEPAALIRVVAGSCRVKAAVVEADEREAWRRMILNFGHTVGHAVEAATGYRRFLHGEAVAIGMVAAGRLALAAREKVRGPAREIAWNESDQARLERLLAAFDLPVAIPGLSLAGLMAAMALDKKSLAGAVRWVLPARLGAVEIVPGLPSEQVEAVLLALGAAPAETHHI